MNLVLAAFISGAALMLSACASKAPTTPVRLADMPISSTGSTAFIWTSGTRALTSLFYLRDYGTITHIDGTSTPDDFLPSAGNAPYRSWLLEITVGNHDIEILHKEETPLCYLGCLTMEKFRRTITFVAEPNRIYAPFVSDDCDRDWLWIEDWGPYIDGMETREFVLNISSDLTKIAVAGEAPPKDSCG